MASRPQIPEDLGVFRERTKRVLIVDDSAVARYAIRRILQESGGFEVVGDAASAPHALTMLEARDCDIILLDIEMPGMSGLDAIPLLRKASGAAVIVLSSHCAAGAEASVRAMTLGASDTLSKPTTGWLAEEFTSTLLRSLGRIADARITADSGARPVRSAAAVGLSRPVRCLAIGASTGGVHATLRFLETLPPAIEMPILVTQHLPGEFIGHFAAQMRLSTGRNFMPAVDGMSVAAGDVIVAPGDAHLGAALDDEGFRVCLRHHKVASGCVPSVDPMLESVAAIFGRDAVGVILSGMGKDGAEGARALADKGGELLVQDSESAVVWGMPGAVARQGIAGMVADPATLGAYVGRRAGAHGWR